MDRKNSFEIILSRSMVYSFENPIESFEKIYILFAMSGNKNITFLFYAKISENNFLLFGNLQTL